MKIFLWAIIVESNNSLLIKKKSQVFGYNKKYRIFIGFLLKRYLYATGQKYPFDLSRNRVGRGSISR